MTSNQNKKGLNYGEWTRRELKDVLCNKYKWYGHNADQYVLRGDEARKSREANLEARDQDCVKRATKEVTLMHIRRIK